MIIIIPLGGTGQRFKSNGYKDPKALIKVFGKPILYYLLDSLNVAPSDMVCIPYNKEYNEYRLEDVLKKNYPNILFKFMDNNGYGAAINFGSKFVQTKYFIVSNPDVSGLDNDNIEIFHQFAFKINDKFSVLGPRFVNADPKSINQIDSLKKIFGKMKFKNSEYLAKKCFSVPIEPTLNKKEIQKIVKILNSF